MTLEEEGLMERPRRKQTEKLEQVVEAVRPVETSVQEITSTKPQEAKETTYQTADYLQITDEQLKKLQTDRDRLTTESVAHSIRDAIGLGVDWYDLKQAGMTK